MITITYDLSINAVPHIGEFTIPEDRSIQQIKLLIQSEIVKRYQHNVPLGLIHLTYKGSRIESEKEKGSLKRFALTKITISSDMSLASPKSSASSSSSSSSSSSPPSNKTAVVPSKKLKLTVQPITTILKPIETKEGKLIKDQEGVTLETNGVSLDDKVDYSKLVSTSELYTFFRENHKMPAGEEKSIAALKNPEVKRSIVEDNGFMLFVICLNSLLKDDHKSCSKLIRFILMDDPDYKKLFTKEMLFSLRLSSIELRHPIFQELLPSLIQTQQDLQKLAELALGCSDNYFGHSRYGIGFSRDIALRLFLGDHPQLTYLVLDQSLDEQVNTRSKIIATAIPSFPTVLARVVAEYGHGEYSPSAPNYFSCHWAFLNCKSVPFSEKVVALEGSPILKMQWVPLPDVWRNEGLEINMDNTSVVNEYLNYFRNDPAVQIDATEKGKRFRMRLTTREAMQSAVTRAHENRMIGNDAFLWSRHHTSSIWATGMCSRPPWEDKLEWRPSWVQIRWPKKDENFILELYFDNYDHGHRYTKYFAGLERLAEMKIINFHNGAKEPNSFRGYDDTTLKPSEIPSNADIGTVIVLSQNSVKPVRVIFKTLRGVMAGVELAIQNKILSETDEELLSRQVADRCGQTAFKQAVIMIGFCRAVKEPALQPAIDPLLPSIMELIGDNLSEQVPFDTRSFASTQLFKIHVNDEVLSTDELAKRTRPLQSYASPIGGFYSSHKPLAKGILADINNTSVKSKKFINFLVCAKVDAEKAKGVSFNEEGDFTKAIAKILSPHP